MAQAPRTTVSTSDLSDDPIEKATHWAQTNQKPLLYGAAAIVVAVSAILIYRSNEASTREKASRALYEAQAPMSEGKLPEAEAALQKVSARYVSTAAGQQATILLAHVLFEQKKFAEGITALQKAQGATNGDFASSLESTIAAGYEAQGKFAEAGEHYGKAAGLATQAMEKGQMQSSQARALMLAGKPDEAKTIWEDLSKDESLPFAQEAQVRLGEIAGAKK